jgi:hypothetical protein
MSLNRAALRLATIMALTNGFAAPYPTLARANVFDSRLDPIEGKNKTELVPTIVVYTDDDSGASLSNNNGGPPFRRNVHLVLELMIGMMGEDGDAPVMGLPATDAELEAMLDLFETQARFALTDISNRWATLLGEILIRTKEWSSQRWVTAEGSVRLAARQITAQVEIRDDDMPAGLYTAQPAALPGHLQALLDAAETADAPGHIQSVIAAIGQAGVPASAALDALKSIHFFEKTPDGAPDLEATAEGLDS